MGGGDGYDGGLVDRYAEEVVSPESLTAPLRAVAAAAIAGGYAASPSEPTAGGRAHPAAGQAGR